MCCISVGKSTSYKVATLFDTRAYTLFRSRMDQRARTRRLQRPPCRYQRLGTVVFDLTFFNEIKQSNDTIHSIDTQAIDSCIAVIISTSVIREQCLVTKIPQCFDEIPRSKPDQSQSVTPAAAPSATRAVCLGSMPCMTCSPFVTQGYNVTLCSLTVRRSDHPHVPIERRRRPHDAAFADHTQIIVSNNQGPLSWMQSRTMMTSSENQNHLNIPTGCPPNHRMNCSA